MFLFSSDCCWCLEVTGQASGDQPVSPSSPAGEICHETQSDWTLSQTSSHSTDSQTVHHIINCQEVDQGESYKKKKIIDF